MKKLVQIARDSDIELSTPTEGKERKALRRDFGYFILEWKYISDVGYPVTIEIWGEPLDYAGSSRPQ